MNEEIKARINYTKNRQAIYMAHLDTIDIITKALRRLQMPYAVTQGCHVRPRLSFGPPLPLGHASYCEFFIVTLHEKADPQWIKEALTKELPEGMEVNSVIIPYEDRKKPNNGEIVEYRFTFTSEEAASLALSFLQNPETEFSATQKGRIRKYKLGKAVINSELTKDRQNYIIYADFNQGIADVPSVSKIVTAMAFFLQKHKDNFVLMERLAIREPLNTGEIAV